MYLSTIINTVNINYLHYIPNSEFLMYCRTNAALLLCGEQRKWQAKCTLLSLSFIYPTRPSKTTFEKRRKVFCQKFGSRLRDKEEQFLFRILTEKSIICTDILRLFIFLEIFLLYEGGSAPLNSPFSFKFIIPTRQNSDFKYLLSKIIKMLIL